MPKALPTSNEPNICERLIQARKCRFPSLDDLASRMSVARAEVYKWENGVSRPVGAQLDEYAAVLGLTRTEVVKVYGDIDLENLAMEIRCTRIEANQPDANHAQNLAHTLSKLLAEAAKSERTDAILAKELESMADQVNELGDRITVALGEWLDRAYPMQSVRAEILTAAAVLADDEARQILLPERTTVAFRNLIKNKKAS